MTEELGKFHQEVVSQRNTHPQNLAKGDLDPTIHPLDEQTELDLYPENVPIDNDNCEIGDTLSSSAPRGTRW